MAVNDPSTNFEWALPDVGGDTDVWDDNEPTNLEGLNSLFNEIDTDVKAVADELDVVEADASDLDTRVVAIESAQILPVYVRATMLSKPAIPTSTATAVPLAGVLDSVGMFDAGEPTRLTIPDGSDGPLSQDGRFNLGGLYKLKAFAHVPTWTGGSNSRAWTLIVRKNGTTDIASRRWPSFSDGQTNTEDELSLLVECMDEAGPSDYYELVLLTDSGIQAGVLRDATFEAYRLPSPRFAVPHVLYSAGLDVHGNGSADFDRYDQASVAGDTVAWASTEGKFGGGALRQRFGALSQSLLRHTVLETARADGLASFYVKNTSGDDHPVGEILRVLNGTTLHFRIESDTDGILTVKNNAGSTLATGTNALTGDGYTHVEVAWLLSTTGTGICRVWVDETLDIDASGLTNGNGSALWDAYGRHAQAGGLDGHFIDDFVLQKSTGQRLGGGHRIYAVLPDADAGTNEWTPTTGTDHYAMVDDTDPDQQSTDLTSTGVGQREEFTFTLPSISGNIREVVLHALADGEAGDTGKFKLGLRVDGKEELSGDLFRTGTDAGGGTRWNEYLYPIAGNPNGGVFTAANLADAVILMESLDNDSPRVTQVWLEILTTA